MAWYKKNKEVAKVPEEEIDVSAQPEVKAVDTYNVYVGCENCQFVEQLAIPKKISVEKIIDKRECSNCGLKSVKSLTALELKELSK